MEIIRAKKIDESNMVLDCNSGISREISEAFAFYVPNYKFVPAYKNGVWDGRIRIYNGLTRLMPIGLTEHLEKFASNRNYEIEYIPSQQYGSPKATLNVSDEEIIEFIKKIDLRIGEKKIEIRDYQLKAILHGIRNKRAVMLSPTGSGKSLIQYIIIRYLVEVHNRKALLIVPTTSLVEQMYSDFESYGWDAENLCHRIYSGKDKSTTLPVVITTWQSVYKLQRPWFKKFTVLMGDESHLFKAKSLSSIINKMGEADFKIGVSGTLDGSEVNELVLQGHFGKVFRVTKTKILQEDSVLSKIDISVINLIYPEEDRKNAKGFNYQQELDFVITNSTRNKFIKNLTKSLSGNTLILFQYVKKHGKILYDEISDIMPDDRKVFYVSGEVKTDVRENIRKIVETETDAVICASYGTYSTGINIRNIHNIILASPSKSQVRVLQSIGRGLRIADNQNDLKLYDIADDLRWKSRINFLMKHSVERCRIYNKEEFPWKVHEVKINE
jgi:superfamily II DNA or RNA helicase